MPVTVEVQGYRFEELSDKARERAREIVWPSHRDYDDAQEFVDLELLARGLDDLQPEYDLSFCQGSGLGLRGTIYIEEITDPVFQPIQAMLGANTEGGRVGDHEVRWSRPIVACRIDITCGARNGWIGHMDFDVEVSYAEDDSEDDNLEDDHPLVEAIAAYFKEACRSIHRQAEDLLMRDRADELLEEAEARGLLFTEDGQYLAESG